MAMRELQVGTWLVLCLAGVMPAFGAGVQGAQWASGGQDLNNTRSQSAEHRLGTANVAGLKARWAFTAAGDISATPAVESGAVYFPDFGGQLWKLDADTGRVIWSRSISEYTGIPGSASRTSPAVSGDRVVIGALQGGLLMAIDKNTGELLWKTQLDPHPAALITQSPVIFGGRVYVGLSSSEEYFATDPSYPCCTFRGSMVSVDLESGEVLWQSYVVPEGYSGGAIWGSTPVVDPSRGSLYFTTGNNYEVPESVAECVHNSPPEQAESCLAPNNYIDAFVAMDLHTGAIKWARRLQGFDAWTFICNYVPPGVTWCPSPMGPDYDFGQGPMLFTVKIDGRKKDLLGAGQKSGIFWALDPDNGDIVWNTLVGPGGALGGIMWGSATDGERIYVANSNRENKPHTLVSGQQISGGSWSALDPATGQILWQTADPLGGAAMGAVTVANGVVYAGSMDPQGHMYAMDARTGTILWSFASGGSINSGAAVVGGTVFWGSGYSRGGMGTGSKKFYAFSVEK